MLEGANSKLRPGASHSHGSLALLKAFLRHEAARGVVHVHDYLLRVFVPTAGCIYIALYSRDPRNWPRPWRAGPQAIGMGTTVPLALALRFVLPVDFVTSKTFQFYAFAVALLHVELLFTLAYWITSCRYSTIPSFQSFKRHLQHRTISPPFP